MQYMSTLDTADEITYSSTTMSAQVDQTSNRIFKDSEMTRSRSRSSKESYSSTYKETGDEEEKPKKRRITANVKETGFDSMKYYMKTMGNHELLKKNEEIILAREIQILIKWEEQREDLEAKLMR